MSNIRKKFCRNQTHIESSISLKYVHFHTFSNIESLTYMLNIIYSKNRIRFNMIQKSILDLPDEIIEEIMTFLTFNDLLNLRNTGKLLRDCAKRIIEKKTFSKYNIQAIILSNHIFNIPFLYII